LADRGFWARGWRYDRQSAQRPDPFRHERLERFVAWLVYSDRQTEYDWRAVLRKALREYPQHRHRLRRAALHNYAAAEVDAVMNEAP
jgi:hypothetical protein